MKVAGGFVNYINDDPWNITDFGSIIFYVIYFYCETHDSYNIDNTSLTHIILSQIIFSLTLIKVLFFLRLSESFGSLVQMLLKTVAELKNFTVFLFIMIFYFAISLNMIKAKFSDSDYPKVTQKVVTLI